MTRGFGIPATPDEALVRSLVPEVQQLGYRTFWVNDTPVADGLACLSWAAAETDAVRLGVGVIACDRRSPDDVASQVSASGIPYDRLVLGLGAGFSETPLSTVRRAVERIRELLPEVTLGVAAMGPRMCALAGEVADLVLLNWMTPERISWAREIVDASEGRPEVAAYVRVGLGRGSSRLLEEEASRYASLPHYARHFEAQGVDPSQAGIAASDPGRVGTLLAAYDQTLDETVVRALADSYHTSSLLDIARAAAPPS